MAVTAEVRKELASLHPSAIIELFEVKTSARLQGACETYRFHAGVNAKAVSGNLVWAGNTYYSWPVEAEGFEYQGNGSLPRPKIRIANVDGTITTVLAEINLFNRNNSLAGALLTRKRTLARFLDAVNFENDTNPFGTPDSLASLPEEIYYIDRKSGESKDLVEFELVAAFDLAGMKIPKRVVLPNTCLWRYRGAECGYTGLALFNENDISVTQQSQDVCGKRISSCEARFGTGAELPFGGFPGLSDL